MPAKAPAKGRYTKPALRERLKKRIQAGTKGGKAGQWSARKAQLLTQEYKKAGGGFRGGRSASQRHLKEWTDEKWRTSDRKPAQRKGGTARYLPDAAWKKLSKAERAATDRKKQKGSRKGKQFVANTSRAKTARKTAARRPAKRAARSR